MIDLKVNTDKVIATAGNIRNYNIKTRDAFSDVVNAISQLDDNWDGEAATCAITRFKELRSDYCSARYNVIENYVNLLLNQVGADYEHVENTNKSLADVFK